MSRSLCRRRSLLFVYLLLLVLPSVTVRAEPLLWKIQGQHATVYLFGSIHLLKSDTQWRSAKFDAAFRSSGSLWEELENAGDMAAAQPLLAKYGVDSAHPLATKLDAAGEAKLLSTAKALGIAENQLEPLEPWLAALELTVAPIVKAGYDPNSGTDLALRKLALAQGKPVHGFETIEQQIHYFADLPQTTQIQYLLVTVDQVKTIPAQLDGVVDAWNSGDAAKLQRLLVGHAFERYPGLYDALVVQRNAMFAHDIEGLLNGNGIAFVAVGAAHLVGTDSVITDLAHDGFVAAPQ